MTGSEGAKDRLRLWLRLLRLSRHVDAHLRDRLRVEFKTTLPRFDVMAALSRHPEGLKMSQLSGVLRVSNGNVTGIADRLAEEGLVERVPVPRDRRAMTLRRRKRIRSAGKSPRGLDQRHAWRDQRRRRARDGGTVDYSGAGR